MEQAKAKILVVDDTKTNIEVLENVLMDHYDVFVAKNGKKAIEIAEKVLPDLILLDVMMPEMNGYETMRAMKGMESLKNIPVFFLTAKSDNESEQIGLDLGAVDYIGKPFNPQLVLLRVKNQLEYKRQRDHLHELVDEKTADLRRTLKVMLTSLGSLAEFRDPETGGHIKRTQVIVQRLAEVLQNNPKYTQAIPSSEYVDFYATAAPLHDIGKVGIEDEILRKPAKLNEQEREIMSKHPRMGYDVLMDATKELHDNPMVRIAADIALAHHERWDGQGYPSGLKGEEIPVGARLMAVADVYDALVSRRPYKDAYPHQFAVGEIVKAKGTQFDPDVVDAFLAIADELPATYELFKDQTH
ncbi:MAG: response regulator [Fibrobacter sp.]|uniref:HD-GYP domain-containing protein n=1 Tax=Fibrobacter sp. TaxID=35828 RepID=UPI0025C437E6|nr:HD domain-containing phosphohydrolase [Fibrobacter sp.]MBR4785765.1 response regulator [Fibrobacter sp.]